MYSIKNRKLRNFKNISCKNKPEAGWKGYNFDCWKSELCVGQNSQISYSFILNDLILFYQYIHSHSRHIHSHWKQNFYSTQLFYSFNILCASVFPRISDWIPSSCLWTLIFWKHVFLKTPEYQPIHTEGILKMFYTGRLRPEVQPIILFYWRMIPLSHT